MAIRRYRVFFVVGSLILGVQVFLACKFLRIDAEDQLRVSGMEHGIIHSQGKEKPEVVDELSLSSRKFKDNYSVDDEDSPSNSNQVNSLHRNKVPPDKSGQYENNAVDNGPSRNTKYSSQLAGVQKDFNRTSLRLEDLDFVPVCDVQVKEAVSAIHRARTQKCKRELANVTCLIQQGKLYPTHLPNFCLASGHSAGRSLGCYQDERAFRILSGYYANLKNDNSPQQCINLCLQSGFTYAGVQYSSECFCGNDEPPSSARLPDSSCNMKCPLNPREACGGFFTINVFETGISKFTPQVPREVPDRKETPVKIAFLLTLNGRAVRQVQRLIKVLFHKDHFFYIHVDSRQDYLYRELLYLEKLLPNIHLTRTRFATIWGGASLLQMLLHCMTDLINIKWNWDFVINLSESDFPIKTNDQLVSFLTANKGKNFVKSHGREVQRFIQKQGLDKTFYECDTHMWRVGDRVLPWGVQMDGGSDWVSLSRSFVDYIVNTKDKLVDGLKTVFKYTLLPAESFFHTVLRNSKFCHSYVDNNLHVTNWKRRLGCKCQYKHVVDWCGCSPNDFKSEDWPRLQATEDRQLYFARKFEPVVNQAIIQKVEEWLYGSYASHFPNLHSYWQNTYHHLDLSPPPDEALVTIATSLSRLSIKMLVDVDHKCAIHPTEVLEVTSYHQSDNYKGSLVLFEAAVSGISEKIKFETWIVPKHHFTVIKSSALVERLKLLLVSSDFDQKEYVSRNLFRTLGPFSEPSLMYQFVSGDPANVTFLWVDPAQTIAGASDVLIENLAVVNFIKPGFRQPLRPGVWAVKMIHNGVVLVQTEFLISPFEFISGVEISQQQAGFLHNGPGQAYSSQDVMEYEKYLSTEDRGSFLRKALVNSKRFGPDLREWIDSLTARFYTIQDTCFVHHIKKKICSGAYLDSCQDTFWSSLAPDPKSEIGVVNVTTGRLHRWL